MKNLTLLLAVLSTACANMGMVRQARSERISSNPPASFVALDAQISAMMEREDVKGLAIAIIDGELVSHIRTFGFANVERRVPLETDTIMYGASITKAAFTYMVLQLVEEGQLDLDRPIGEYLEKPLPEYDEGDDNWSSLQGDDEWMLLTPRILLSHSSGLANLRWLERDMDMQFHFAPGKAYAYSGEGFYLLQFVIEEGLGLDVKAEMQRRIFDRFEMPNTSMQWREDFATHLADGYKSDGSFVPHDARDNVSASGSMDTTIADQARMWRGMLNGEGLSSEMRSEWVRPQVPIRTARKFPTIAALETFDPRGEHIRLAGALGVDAWQGPSGPYFAKGGHNDWTGNLVICRDTRKRCVVLLSNSVRAEIIFPEIVDMVLGDTAYPWWWTYPDLHGRPERE